MATVRLQLRRGTADDWFDANPTLAAGEIGIETDTNTFKFGDGATAWNSLAYALSGTVDDYILLGAKGVANGVASLDGSGLIPLAQIPGAAALDAEVATAVTNHNNLTTSVHGIANTANLVTLDANQTLTSKTLSSPALTGTPTAPTANAGTDTTQVATTAFVQDAIELVVGAAPAALNTLAEIATSLADNADLSGTLTSSISGKVAKSGDTMSGVLNMGTNKITSVGLATTDFDAANKFYVDARVMDAVTLQNTYTTNVHGIANTANLVVTTDPRLSDVRTPAADSVGTAQIQNDAVSTVKIADSAITTNKINNSSVTVAKIAADAVTTPAILDANVTGAKIATDAISQYHLSSGSVGTAEIIDESITSTKIAANAVVSANIVDANVTEAKINTAAVTADKIGSLAVTEGKIADSAVTTVKIADSAITTGKIANGTVVDADINAAAAIAMTKIDGLGTALDSKLASATAASTYAPIASPTFTGTVAGVTKAHVGLSDVDNTSDASKPVSTAQATAIATAKAEAIADATSQVNAVISGAPLALNTLDELAAALGDDQNFAASVTTSLGLKAPIASPTFTGTVTVAAAGVAFTDGTQTKKGVPSLTTTTTNIGNDYNLNNGGGSLHLNLIDQLINIGGAYTITVPADADTLFPLGASIQFWQSGGAGGATFSPASAAVTIHATPGNKLRAQYSSATLTKVNANTWLLAGDLKA